MSATREQVMRALFELLSRAGPFKSAGRRNRKPETIPAHDTPALMLVEHSDHYANASTSQPSVRRMMVRAIVYSDVGTNENAIPAAIVNPILDAIDAALRPAVPGAGACTLGGLVASVVIDGTIIKAPGDVTGKSVAIVPLNILLP